MDIMNKPTKWILAATGTTVVLLLGVGIGETSGSTGDQPSSAKLYAPTVTVTKQAPTTAMTAGTPQSCLDALDDAEVLYNDAGDLAKVFAQMAPINQRAVTAAFNHDIPAMEAVTAEIQAKTAGIRRITAMVSLHGTSYRADAQDCRAGA
jgi:hypothetical protein